MSYELPNPQEVGQTGEWTLPTTKWDEVGARHIQDVTFEGNFLGFSTSQREPARERWSEFRIFRLSSGGYLVHIAGLSSLPAEQIRPRLLRALSPHEVISVLIKREGFSARLTYPADRVLAQASHFDEGIHDAYVNRAVI